MKSPYFGSKMTNDYIVYYLSGGFPLWNDLHRWSLLNISRSIVFLHIGKTCLPPPTPSTSDFVQINISRSQESVWQWQSIKIQKELEAAEDAALLSVNLMWILLSFFLCSLVRNSANGLHQGCGCMSDLTDTKDNKSEPHNCTYSIKDGHFFSTNPDLILICYECNSLQSKTATQKSMVSWSWFRKTELTPQTSKMALAEKFDRVSWKSDIPYPKKTCHLPSCADFMLTQ